MLLGKGQLLHKVDELGELDQVVHFLLAQV